MMDIQPMASHKCTPPAAAVIDKRQVMKAFNDHFIDFFEDVERVFPDNSDITAAKNAIITFRKMNPRLLICVFHESVGRMYREQLDCGNLGFFVEKDYTVDLKNNSNADSLIHKINALRDPINNMSQTDQDIVVQYLNNLVKLCEMYHE